MRHEHLARNIPNNRLTRWLVSKANEKMGRSESRYRLRIRYRQPKTGGYGGWGSVERDNARAFSLYLRRTPC